MSELKYTATQMNNVLSSSQEYYRNWKEAEKINKELRARISELAQAVGLITTLKPTMVMDTEHPLEMAKEVAEYVTARIAELEARLESCESALTSMVYQFFYSSGSGALAHSFMSAEEEAAEYLVDYGIARWENEHKNSIVFEEVQE